MNSEPMSQCIWCNVNTTTNKNLIANGIRYANKEHIFPESVGGKKTLPQGIVCEDCNNRLGREVDPYLKSENFMMMQQYQISSKILKKPLGKNRNREDKERKEKEIYKLSGYSNGCHVERNKDDFSHEKLTNLPDGSAGDISYNDKFSKALHKCAVNVLLDKNGYEYVKKNHSELIDFVNSISNNSFTDWSYAVCYKNIFSQIHFEPFCFQMIEYDSVILGLALIFPSAIYIVCTKPKIMDIELLKSVTNNLPKLQNLEKEGFDYFNHYKSSFVDDNYRKSFGQELKFTFIKKEIEGNQNPDDAFYLLTKCKTCGQINPTGIMLGKDNILNGNQNSSIGGTKNSWNKYILEDLQKKGYSIENWKEDSLREYIETQGISYPKENDVKKLNITNCKCRCINCYAEITYDAKDCFL